MSARPLTVLVLLAIASGCAADGKSDEPIAPAAIARTCEELCDHEVTCGRSVDLDGCVSLCQREEILSVYRGDRVAELTYCLTSGCFDGDVLGGGPGCWRNVPPEKIHLAYEEACADRLATCRSAGEIADSCSLSDTESAAIIVRLLIDSVIEEYLACFEAPACEEAAACASQLSETYGLLAQGLVF